MLTVMSTLTSPVIGKNVVYDSLRNALVIKVNGLHIYIRSRSNESRNHSSKCKSCSHPGIAGKTL